MGALNKLSILCCGDIHIDYSNRFEDMKKTLNQIIDVDIVKQPDLIILLGDIYDKRLVRPEESNLFYEFIDKILTRLGKDIIVVKGNHDTTRDATNLDVFEKLKVNQN